MTSLKHRILRFAAYLSAFLGAGVFLVITVTYVSTDLSSLTPATQQNLHNQYFGNLLFISFVFLFSYSVLQLQKADLSKNNAALNEQLTRELKQRDDMINAHAWVSRTSTSGNIVYINDAFAKALGYEPSELIGKPAHSYFPGGADGETFVEISSTLCKNGTWSGLQKLRCKSGEILEAATTILPEFDEAGALRQFVAIRSDVSQQRNKEAMRYMMTALDELQDDVYVYDVDDLEILYANRVARERWGWKRDQPGLYIQDTAETFDVETFRRHTAPLLSGEQDLVTVQAAIKSGPIEISTRLLDCVDNKRFFISVLRDLSWRKTAENEKLKFMSMMSHELRTPLTSIHGSLQLLRSGALGELDTRAGQAVSIAGRNTSKLLQLVNEILDYQKVNANQMHFAIGEMDIAPTLEEVRDLMAGYASEHSVDIDIDVTTSSTRIVGDADRLSQVLVNFASNAIKYSPKGGRIRLCLDETEDGLRVSVVDQGPGISEEKQRKLFRPFSQVEAEDGMRRTGTGLGLAIVRAILQRHEFPVGIESEIGQGSRFYFIVPPAHVLSAPEKLERTA